MTAVASSTFSNRLAVAVRSQERIRGVHPVTTVKSLAHRSGFLSWDRAAAYRGLPGGMLR
jgi:hypothetical protein